MTPEELAERLTRLEEQMSQTRQLFADHIASEEQQFADIADNVRELRDILVGAKGAIKALGWIVMGLAAIGGVITWVNHNVTLGLR